MQRRHVLTTLATFGLLRPASLVAQSTGVSLPWQTYGENRSGTARPGSPDPSIDQLLLPEPSRPGWVRVPLSASIQSDGPEPLVTCHGLLGPTGHAFDRALDTFGTDVFAAGPAILWALKLTPLSLVGGEFFIPVPAFPIPYGMQLYVNWSFATAAHAIRTRSVSVEVPLASVDWTRIRPLPGEPALTVR